MCHEATGASYDRPLFAEDVPLIAKAFPNLYRQDVDALFAALTDNHFPQPAVLITVCEMVTRYQQGDAGYYTFPTMPFSAMDLETFERVQTPSMLAFHAVFESMALAQRNMMLLNQVLKERFGLQLVLFCDCGCDIMPADQDPYGGSYKAINQLRSLAEAAGTPIVRPMNFTDPMWTSRNLDMGPAEIRSYERMFALLQTLPKRAFDIKDLIGTPLSRMLSIPA